MARSTRKSTAPTKPLLKPPIRIGNIDTAAVIGELRQLHEAAEDMNVDRMPADEELFGALLHLETHADALKDERAQRESAIKRVRLWEYLREQVDLHQSKAIEQARAAGVQWVDLAPSLAVNAPSAAYNKAKRLQAAVLTEEADRSPVDKRPVRRTPEAVREFERLAAAKAAARRRAEAEAASRHALLSPLAQRLIEQRAGLDDEGEATYWLDQIAEVLTECRTPTQLVSLETYVKAVVRELRKIERTTARPAASTADAQAAYAAAAKLIDG
ncbi:hypothetical protein OHT68_49030 (plasmid) [Streptomyces canus]|uniref:hypothetical protein n=1 Tax=Streptomyces canus TaxID=58343 RepID=UPI002E27EFC8|nr:hypothetical protein [Streptomyces canus]